MNSGVFLRAYCSAELLVHLQELFLKKFYHLSLHFCLYRKIRAIRIRFGRGHQVVFKKQ